LDAHHYVIGGLETVGYASSISFVDHRPLDARRPLLKLSFGAKLPKETNKRKNTKENWRILCFFFDPRSSILIFCDFRKRLDDLRCVAVAGASLVVSLKR
jgi:hypothetical protein